jgi:hypothetical protein
MQPLLPFNGAGSKKGYIYFATDGDFVKIGWTGIWPPSERIKKQQTGNGRPIWILGCIPGSQNAERGYHRRFARHRVRGEWFRLTPDLEQFIRATHMMDFMDLVA